MQWSYDNLHKPKNKLGGSFIIQRDTLINLEIFEEAIILEWNGVPTLNMYFEKKKEYASQTPTANDVLISIELEMKPIILSWDYNEKPYSVLQ